MHRCQEIAYGRVKLRVAELFAGVGGFGRP